MDFKEMQQCSIYGTAEEKLKLLEQDPFRYYIHENVWVPRGQDRIDLLEGLLEEAVREEKYELCSEIVRVKGLLLSRMEEPQNS